MSNCLALDRPKIRHFNVGSHTEGGPAVAAARYRQIIAAFLQNCMP